jgi:hypothetical protein
MKAINLIPIQRRQAKARKARLLRWGAAISAYAVALALGHVLFANYAIGDTCSLDARSKRVTSQLDCVNQQSQETGQKLAEAMKKLQTAQAIGQQPDWGMLLAMLSQNVGEDVVLDFCGLQRSDAAEVAVKPADAAGAPEARKAAPPLVLAIGGFARAQAEVSVCVLRLEKLNLFDKVKLVKTARGPFQGHEAIMFRLECLFPAGQGAGK